MTVKRHHQDFSMRITSTGLLYDEPERSTPGYLLIRPSEGDSSFLLDPDGEVAHSWTGRIGMTNWAYLLPNGNLSVKPLRYPVRTSREWHVFPVSRVRTSGPGTASYASRTGPTLQNAG